MLVWGETHLTAGLAAQNFYWTGIFYTRPKSYEKKKTKTQQKRTKVNMIEQFRLFLFQVLGNPSLSLKFPHTFFSHDVLCHRKNEISFDGTNNEISTTRKLSKFNMCVVNGHKRSVKAVVRSSSHCWVTYDARRVETRPYFSSMQHRDVRC